MNGNYLLDTNIAIARTNREAAVEQRVNASAAVFLACITVGELFYGAQKSGRAAENVRRVQAIVAANTVLVCDSGTAYHYGITRSALRAKGRPIPDNDIWIAALAVQHNLTLATRDAHFTGRRRPDGRILVAQHRRKHCEHRRNAHSLAAYRSP